MLCASAMSMVFLYDGKQHFEQQAYLYSPDSESESFEDFIRGKLAYVKELLSKKPAPVKSTANSAFQRFLENKKERIRVIWKGHPGFKYPTRVLCTYVSLLVLMYYLIYQAVLFERETLGSIDSIVHERVQKRMNRTRTAAQFFAEIVVNGEISLHSNEDYLQYLSHALTMVESTFIYSNMADFYLHDSEFKMADVAIYLPRVCMKKYEEVRTRVQYQHRHLYFFTS